MKTTEEKARAYDEAIERAKECHIDGLSLHQPVKDVIEHIFPEPKESEDEKIRKHLITLFINDYGKNSNARFAGIKVKDIIAWLEKQGDRKPAWSEEDENEILLLEALCDDKINSSTPGSTMYRVIYELKDWLKSIKDRVQPKN